MNVLVIGAGPTGLYYSILHKKRYPNDHIVVVERNAAGSTFGWGVVFSDATMDNLYAADEESADLINQSLNHWDDIKLHYRGKSVQSTGHGFIGIGRLCLLQILEQRCKELGVEFVYETFVEDDIAAAKKYNADIVLSSNGLNSFVREKYSEEFGCEIDQRLCRFSWLGTHKLFDAFTFILEQHEFGWVAVHAYRFNEDTSTFIIEMREESWKKVGLDSMQQEQAVAWCEKLFAPYLDSNALLNNATHLRGSANWLRFPRIHCQKWHTWQQVDDRNIPLVLMGDAAHTAHFSIGSGTKLGFEDAIALDRLMERNNKNLAAALNDYETERRVAVAKIQKAAINSCWWFENIDVHAKLDPEQFYYSLLTRSQRLFHENLFLRDASFINSYERKYFQGSLPALAQISIGNVVVKNRCTLHIDVADNGDAGELYRQQNAQGSGLIISSPVVVCPMQQRDDNAFWKDEHISQWQQRVADVHANNNRFALLLDPGSSNSTPNTISVTGIQSMAQCFADAAKRAVHIGSDFIALNFADDNVLQQFISPHSNQRKDDYGNPHHLALQVVRAVQHYASDIPLIAKINADEAMQSGINIERALQLSLALESNGVQAILVASSLNTTSAEKNRMYNGCYADEICNQLKIPVIITGKITTLDEANTIIAAHRADLVAFDMPAALQLSLEQQAEGIYQSRTVEKEKHTETEKHAETN